MKTFTERPLESSFWLRRALGLALVGFLVLCALPALAQDPDPEADEDEQESAAAEDEMALDEVITVTARKREENIQEVPVAITVLTGEFLEDNGAMDIAELQASVPNLSIYPGRNQSTTLTAFMRGIGQADPLAPEQQSDTRPEAATGV